MKKGKISKIHILHTVNTYLKTQSQTSIIVVQYGQDSNLDEWLNRRMVHKSGLSEDSSSQTIMFDGPEETIVARSITISFLMMTLFRRAGTRNLAPRL